MYSVKVRTFAMILVGGILAGCGQEESESGEKLVRPVKALKVADPSALEGRWFSGRAQAVDQVELSFRVPGTLVELPVKVGDQVEKSSVVAQLDPSTYQTEVDRLEAEVKQAEASLENAQLQLARHEELLKKEVTSAARVDRQRAKVLEDQARLQGAKAAQRKAELDLRYATLRAPFSSTVVATYVENFEDVRAKERILRLLDPSQIEMVINIPENLIALSTQVTEIHVVFDAIPNAKIPAKVKEIGLEASQTTRTYPVTLIMELPADVSVLPGMAGKATGKPGKQSEFASNVVVPPTSLFATPEKKSAVWVVDEKSMTVALRGVEIGSPTGTGIRIKNGLEPKEWIVTAGMHSLEEGQKVRILKQR